MSFSELVGGAMSGLMALTGAQLSALEAHYRLLVQWNGKMNLTTVIDLPEAGIRHYCESLFVATRVIDGRVVDVGSGPGFPGIPIAVARPELRVDLVEAHQRKCVFLREASRGLKNVAVVGSRAEAVAGQYEWLVSRAVDPTELMKLRMARRYAILLGADDAQKLNCDEVVPLPWGERRVLALGSFAGR